MREMTEGGVTMTLGDRCDEIVRLIDETLVSVGAGPLDTSAHPSGARLPGRGRRPLTLMNGPGVAGGDVAVSAAGGGATGAEAGKGRGDPGRGGGHRGRRHRTVAGLRPFDDDGIADL